MTRRQLIEERYHSWIAALQDRNTQAMHGFVADTITNDGRKSERSQYIQSVVQTLQNPYAETINVDMCIVDAPALAIAARLIYYDKPIKNRSDSRINGEEFQWSVITFVWFNEEMQIIRTHNLTEMDNLNVGHHEYHIAPTPRMKVEPGPAEYDIRAIYRGYLSAVNTQRSKTQLEMFCQPHITHNGQVSDLDEYLTILEDAFSRIQDYHLTIQELVTDEVTQRVAVRLELSGKPVAEAFGIQPTGRSVRFSEHAMYQLDGGKIAFLWALRDFKTYKQCLED
jgi:predicted ester cyclase